MVPPFYDYDVLSGLCRQIRIFTVFISFLCNAVKQPESRQISLMVNEFHKFFNWDKYTIKKSGGEITPGLPLNTKSSRPGVGY